MDQNINNGLATVAVRIPDNQFILQMIKQLNRPMAVTKSCSMSNQQVYLVKTSLNNLVIRLI